MWPVSGAVAEAAKAATLLLRVVYGAGEEDGVLLEKYAMTWSPRFGDSSVKSFFDTLDAIQTRAGLHHVHELEISMRVPRGGGTASMRVTSALPWLLCYALNFRHGRITRQELEDTWRAEAEAGALHLPFTSRVQPLPRPDMHPGDPVLHQNPHLLIFALRTLPLPQDAQPLLTRAHRGTLLELPLRRPTRHLRSLDRILGIVVHGFRQRLVDLLVNLGPRWGLRLRHGAPRRRPRWRSSGNRRLRRRRRCRHRWSRNRSRRGGRRRDEHLLAVRTLDAAERLELLAVHVRDVAWRRRCGYLGRCRRMDHLQRGRRSRLLRKVLRIRGQVRGAGAHPAPGPLLSPNPHEELVAVGVTVYAHHGDAHGVRLLVGGDLKGRDVGHRDGYRPWVGRPGLENDIAIVPEGFYASYRGDAIETPPLTRRTRGRQRGPSSPLRTPSRSRARSPPPPWQRS